MQNQDLERIRFVTRHYRDLRGLQQVAGGLLWLSGGLGETLSRTLGLLAIALQVAVEVGALTLLFFSGTYYRKTFGDVQRRDWTAKQVNWTIVLGALGASIFFPLMVFHPDFRWRFYYLVAGGLFLGMWIWQECRRSQLHYLVLGAPLMVLAVAHPSWPPPFPALATRGTAELLSGTAMILAGLLDHRQLVHILRPSAAVSHEEMQDAESLEVQR